MSDTNLRGVWYKGYDLGWLQDESDHPDHSLVQEYLDNPQADEVAQPAEEVAAEEDTDSEDTTDDESENE